MNQDEGLYLQATQEVGDDVIDPTLWTKSIARAEGDLMRFMFQKIRIMNQDEGLYLQATQEVEDEVIDPALWAKSIALAEGETTIAKYKYIKLRVEQFKQRSGKIEEEKKNREESIESESIQPEERTENENIQPEKRIESERIRQEETDIISGLSELGCKMKHRLFGGWMIREPHGGVVNVRTLDEANAYYQNKKPDKIETCGSRGQTR